MKKGMSEEIEAREQGREGTVGRNDDAAQAWEGGMIVAIARDRNRHR